MRKGCNWSNPRYGRSAQDPLVWKWSPLKSPLLGGRWRTYFAREGTFLAALFVGVLALTGWLFTRGPQGAGSARHAHGRPLAASLLIALMALWWLAPDPPTLFYEGLLILFPIPAAMVARSALPSPIPLTLYGVAFATVLIPLRALIEASAIVDRLLLLLQAISIAAPVAIDLYHGRLQRAFRWLSPGAVRVAALLVFAAAAVTGFHVIFGFTGPGSSLRAGMGSILGFGLVFGASAVALYGAVLALLASPLLRWLRSARDADPSHAADNSRRSRLACRLRRGDRHARHLRSDPDDAAGGAIADERHAGSGHRVHCRQGDRDGNRCRHRNHCSDRA